MPVAERLWPKDRLPALRGAIARARRLLRRLRKTARFLAWSWTCRLAHGRTRWLTVSSGDRLRVRVDDFRAFRIATTHGTQRGAVRVWQAMARLGPDVAVDVGANYGEFTCAVARQVPVVVALEPNPDVFACLTETLRGVDSARPLRLAASDRDGHVTFYHNPVESGAGAMTEELAQPRLSAALAGGHVHRNQVGCRQLATLLPEVLGHEPRSVIFKIDVEGFEVTVLRGALPLLERCEWWLALLEFNPGALSRAGQPVEEVWQFYRQFPGTVLREDDAQNWVFDREQSLPSKPPAAICDLLIGQGVVGTLRLG